MLKSQQGKIDDGLHLPGAVGGIARTIWVPDQDDMVTVLDWLSYGDY